MKDLGFFSRIFLAIDPVDFRKQAHGLALIAESTMNVSGVNEKYLFVFTNRRKTGIEMLYWDTTGYALWWKTLEKEKFRWPKNSSEVLTIPVKELRWLLERIDISKLKKHEEITLT